MNGKSPEEEDNQPKHDITVPRDPHPAPGGGPTMPPADGPRMRDEDYAVQDQPLVPGSPPARALQAHPPKGEGQLGVGTAGDAGRPTKEGLHDKPVPPRGRV